MKVYPITIQNWSAGALPVDLSIQSTSVTLTIPAQQSVEMHASEWFDGTSWEPVEGPSVLLLTVAGKSLHLRPDDEAASAAVQFWGVALTVVLVLCAVFR